MQNRLITNLMELHLLFFAFFSGTCSDPMGLGWNFTLPDSAFSASSSLFSGWQMKSTDFILLKTSTCHGDKICATFVLLEFKGDHHPRGDVQMQHVPWHVPTTFLRCTQIVILSLVHDSATRPYQMTPQSDNVQFLQLPRLLVYGQRQTQTKQLFQVQEELKKKTIEKIHNAKKFECEKETNAQKLFLMVSDNLFAGQLIIYSCFETTIAFTKRALSTNNFHFFNHFHCL